MNKSKKRRFRVLSVMLSILMTQGVAQAAIMPAFAADVRTGSSVGQSALSIDLQSVTTSGSTNAYTVMTFGNEYSDLTRIANAGVKVNGSKLNYNSSYSYISYANAGDCIVSGSTIQFYTSSLSEGENTVVLTNPDGDDLTVRLSMSRTGDYWSGYNYSVEVLPDEQDTEQDADSGFAIDLKTIAADANTSSYTVATFGNDYAELTRIAGAGVIINGVKLTYNSSYSSLYYVNSGDCIVTGNTIQFHTKLLSEGENTVTFVNPDGGEDKIVRLRMTKTEVPPKYWYESTSYEYSVELLEDEPSVETYTVTWKNGDIVLETNANAAKDSVPSYDGDEPFKAEDDTCTYSFAGWAVEEDGEVLAQLPAVTADVTFYAVFTKTEKPQAEQQLYVRIKGGFEHKLVGQQDDVDAISSATTGGSAYIGSASSAHVEYALYDKDTSVENVPDDCWQRPDYFKNGDLLQVDGADSKIIISPECEGVYGEINPFSGDLFLRGVPEKAGRYKVSVYLATDKGNAASNEVDFNVYTGEEKLIDRLTYENCVQTSDGKYMFDNTPWFIPNFGGENETVTVPKDIKAWYGSHAVLPEVNYSEIGQTISLTNGEQPVQTLIIPNGCNLTMVNMRVHSGVKIIVENGAKLTLRQTTVEGIIEVQNGGTFSMDYNDYGSGEWLHGSMINGQLRMKDGSVLENARITAHGNYLAESDNDMRRNFEPVVVTEGNVTVKGDVYILGEEAPSGESGQPALQVSGTLTVPEGSVLACYGGGESHLTADGGDAIILDNGTIQGAGSVIAIGGYGMNITGDTSKGSGGAAVSGSGKIAVANAYLEGGATFRDKTTPALEGAVKIAETTNCKLVDGKSGTTEKSEFYWHGTGDANGIVPQIEKTLAQIPQNAPAVTSGKNAVKVTLNWTDGADRHTGETLTVNVLDKSGKAVKSAEVSAANHWTVTINGLDSEQSYSVEVSGVSENYTLHTEKAENTAGDSWEAVGFGEIEENEIHLITYEENGKTYILGAQDGVLGSAEWSEDVTPDLLDDGFKWSPVKSSSSYYGQWYLMNQGGDKNTYLGMKQNGWDVNPCLYTKDSSTYYTLFADDDGSLWNRYLNKNFYVENGVLTTSGSDFTEFTFFKKVASNADEFTVSAVSYTKVAAQAPTHKDSGNIEYYIGSDGKLYVSNGTDYIETTIEAVTVAAIPCAVHITSAQGGSVRVFAEYTEEDGGRQIYDGDKVPYGTKLTVLREANTGFTLTGGESYSTETLTVVDDTDIALAVAVRTYQLKVTAENGSYTTNADDENAVPYGTQVTMIAGESNPGYVFTGWYEPNGKQLTTDSTYTVGVYADCAVEARYQLTSGTVTFISNEQVIKSQKFTPGNFTESDFPGNPAAFVGYEFVKWNMTADEINAALEKGESVTVTVTAEFAPVKNSFTVSVYNGEAETAEIIECVESAVITRTAERVEGKNFAYWTLDDALLSYNRTASYRAARNGTLRAVYTEDKIEVVGTATVRTAEYNADNHKLTINAYLSVPDNCKITSAGLVASSADKYSGELTWNNAEYKKSLAAAVGKNAPVSYTWTKSNVNPGDVWYVRARLAYTDADGIAHEIYGDLMKITAGNNYDNAEKGTAEMRKAVYNKDTKKATFNAYLTVPDNGIIVKAGLVAASSAHFDPTESVLTAENADYTKSLASAIGKCAPVSYTWNKGNVNPGDVWYARAYLVYTLNGVEHIVYGNLEKLIAE